MSLITVGRAYRSSILILFVFSFVVILFSGYNGIALLGNHGLNKHLDHFTCLFVVCVAIVLFSTLLIVFLVTKAIPVPVLSPKMSPLFLLEKPPRGSA